ELLLQPLVRGMAASAAFLVGDGAMTPLRAGEQCIDGLEETGGLAYAGGILPLPPAVEERALRLAGRAIAAVPGLRGFVGVDLVLREAGDGSEDAIIEVNPRVTTAYVALRRLCHDNLAALWWNLMTGAPARRPRWKEG